MPGLPDQLLETIVFLYQTEEDAEVDSPSGGCGWLTSVPWSSNPNQHHIYVVTNRHVVFDLGAPIVRANTKSGDVEIFSLTHIDWTEHGSSDLAVARINLTYEHKWAFILPKDFLTQESIDMYNVGIGDTAYSAGRFINLRGQKQNRPVVRFGNIALMPPADINGEDLLLVEMRSRTGYSGSPVFTYIDPALQRWRRAEGTKYISLGTETYGPWVLGIQSGQIKPEGPELEDEEGEYTGMTTVVPIEKLTELLEMDKVVSERRQYEKDNPSLIESQSVPTETEGPRNCGQS